MGRLITKTASGAIASFNGNKTLPLESCKVNFLPVQSGTGDPSPSNVRPITGWTGLNVTHCGKNLWNKNNVVFKQNCYRDNNGVEKSSQNSFYTETTFDVVPSVTYHIWDGLTDNTRGMSIYFLTANNNWVQKQTYTLGSTGLYITPTSGICKIQIQFFYQFSYDFEHMQIELGSTATAYEPYTATTYPITFPVMGKNLFNPTEHYFKNDYIRNENGEETSSIYCGYTPNPIAVLPNTQYTISGITETSSATYRIYYLTSSGEWISRSDSYGKQNLPYTFTTPSTCGAIQLQCGITCNYDTCQLEAGSTATAYEPYDNTVYGGQVDLTTGVLTVEYAKYVFTGNETWNAGSVAHRFYSSMNVLNPNIAVQNIEGNAEQNVYSSIYGRFVYKNANKICYIVGIGSILVLVVNDDDLSTTSDAQSIFAGTELVYEITNKITYQLTPTQLTALLGTNNIYSNANSTTEVTYPFFQMGIESNVVEKRRHILLANTHHWVETSGNPVTFNTKMRYPLKQTRINFLPIQEGTGDPSPSNVRPITGWGGLNTTHCGKNLINDSIRYYNANTFILETTESNNYPTYLKQGIYRVTVFGYDKCWAYIQEENDSNFITIFENSDTGTFTITNDNYYKIILLTGTTKEVSNISNVMVTKGTDTVSTYEPYSGTQYPITFPAMGKNLIDQNNYGSKTYDTITFGGTNNVADETLVLKAGTYTASSSTTMSQIFATYRNSSGSDTLLNLQQNVSSLTFTISEECPVRIVFGMQYVTSDHDMSQYNYQLELGSSPTTYEPYDNTVYGGYVDLKTGEVWKTYRFMHFISDYFIGVTDNISGNAQYVAVTSIVGSIKSSGNPDAYLDKFKYTGFNNLIINTYDCILNNNRFVIGLPSELSTLDAFKNWLNSINGFDVCFQIATPTLITTLTPTEIRTLLGTNTIWSDTNGNINLKYLTL